MRTAKSWVDVVHPAAHLGAEGELERQIKRIQDDAQEDLTVQLKDYETTVQMASSAKVSLELDKQDLTAQMAVMVETLKLAAYDYRKVPNEGTGRAMMREKLDKAINHVPLTAKELLERMMRMEKFIKETSHNELCLASCFSDESGKCNCGKDAALATTQPPAK